MAATFKERAIAVVLTGTGSDGNMGLQAIHKMGGTVIAQDEKSAEFFDMPNAAVVTRCVDFISGLDEIPPVMINWARRGMAS